ncbi:SAV_2336 N-terminal domain-related protein [Streptomyces indicus]|uniref:SAV_2336 N-terminal domain-related protein n=1 Tax=Streptomyces indicus TaxID=417292 RepID=UPI000B81944C|nr:SAV_2336 N-terminal domain-related protein [Streptomyces indicus]
MLTEAGGERAGEGPTSVELAELLWLARHMSPGEQQPGEEQGLSHADLPHRPPGAPQDLAPAHPEPTPPPHLPQPSQPPLPEPRVPVHLPEPALAGPGGEGDGEDGFTSLLAPAPPMLARPLTLQRALRPLKRRVPAPAGFELDEQATADRIARLAAPGQAWLPVLRPAAERWLRLRIVYDDGPTMTVWRPLLRELRTALGQSGIFRTLDVHRLTESGEVRGTAGTPADGRTVTLVLSDCMGPQWRAGPAGRRWHATLHRWAARHPVAVVQPLPERLWRTTALPATATTLTAPWPAAPNAAYRTPDGPAAYRTPGAPGTFATYGPSDAAAPGTDWLPLPVLEPSGPWLANWAALVAGSGPVPGAAAHLPPAPTAPAPARSEAVQELGPEELLLRFRALASPEAYRLAGHLAVGRPHLPYMRLVQAALERRPQPGHLAEVILSGLLKAVPGTPGAYTFREGVRELLLGTLPRTARLRTRDLLARLGAPIDDRAGIAAGEIRVAVPGGNEHAAEGSAVASVRAESVRRMGGAVREQAGQGRLFADRYVLEVRLGAGERQTWRARDLRAGRTVVLHLFPGLEPDGEGARVFRWRAGALAAVDHPNVVRLHEHGFEADTAYAVEEFVDGVSLGDVLRGPAGSRVPFWLLARLAAHTARALAAAHAHGLGHGPLKPADVLIDSADGAVRLTGFLDSVAVNSPDEDRERLDTLLHELAGYQGFRAWSLLNWQILSQVEPLEPDPDRDADAIIALLASPDFGPIIQRAATQAPQFQLIGAQLCPGAEQLSPEAKACLVILLERYGRPVPVADVARGLWGEDAGEDPVPYLEELARALGPGTLAAGRTGYAVLAAPAQIDLHAVSALVDGADFRENRTDPREDRESAEARRSMVQSALDGFEDEPLAGVPGPAARRTRIHLRALHHQLLMRRAEIDLDLGEAETAAADLARLVVRYPESESLRHLHVLALRALGRTDEAIDSYEQYHARVDGAVGPDLEGLHDELYRELLSSGARERAAVVFEFLAESPGDSEQAEDAVGRFVGALLARDLLDPDAYELLARPNGYLVITEPGSSVLPLLPTVLAELGALQAGLPLPVSLRVMFWHNSRPIGHLGRHSLRREVDPMPGEALVVVSRPLYEDARDGAVIPLSHRSFSPLIVQGELVAYVHRPEPVHSPDPSPTPAPEPPEPTEPAEPPTVPRDLVRGPFPIHGGETPEVNHATTAVVYLVPDEEDAEEYAQDTTARYYEVDLTLQRERRELPLPGAGPAPFTASVELTWNVTGPLAFVEADVSSVATALFAHLERVLTRITRRYTAERVGAAQQDVQNAQLEPWPVPGLTVSCSVHLSAAAPPMPQGADLFPSPPRPSRPSRTAAPDRPQRTTGSAGFSAEDAAEALAQARVVLLGFEGPVVRLYPAQVARDISRQLAELIVELRRPDESLRGDRLLKGTGLRQYEGHPHPLDLLRALGDHRLAAPVAERLTRLELEAAATTFPTAHADRLIRTLHASGRRVGIVTDVAPVVVSTYLDARGLGGTLRAGVYGRGPDLTRLMPHPECLRRALDATGGRRDATLLVSSSAAELEAARDLGVPSIGFARHEVTRRNLAGLGCRTVTGDLGDLLDALRTTG